MLRLALKSLLAHKIRFALTAGTIVLGVTFVVAAFVTADSLRATFDEVGADINTGLDFTVRGALPFGEIANHAPLFPTASPVTSAPSKGWRPPRGASSSTAWSPVDGSGEAASTVGPPLAGGQLARGRVALAVVPDHRRMATGCIAVRHRCRDVRQLQLRTGPGVSGGHSHRAPRLHPHRHHAVRLSRRTPAPVWCSRCSIRPPPSRCSVSRACSTRSPCGPHRAPTSTRSGTASRQPCPTPPR